MVSSAFAGFHAGNGGAATARDAGARRDERGSEDGTASTFTASDVLTLADKYLAVTMDNVHWGAQRGGLSDLGPHKPYKFDLYTYKIWDALHRSGGGGTISHGVSYLEPICTYLWQLWDALRDIRFFARDILETGGGASPDEIDQLSDRLRAFNGTLGEVYDLSLIHISEPTRPY